jgi:GDP-4-dehydro-6-deoxy-D-mannose reductase
MKNVLVTGALGFCGKHLVKRLRLEEGARVFGIDLAEEAAPGMSFDEYFCVNVCERDGLDRALQSCEPDTIFHLAGVVGNDLHGIYQVNFMGALCLMESVRKHAPEASVVVIGSSAEYGFASPEDFPLMEDHPCRPISAYGVSKHATVLAAANYVREYGLKIVASRPFNIIGPGIPPTLVVGAILKRIKGSLHSKDKLVIKMGNIHTQRDFIDVNDAVNAYVKMAQGNFWGEVFNICSGRPYSISRIVEMIAAFSGLPVEIEHDPALVRALDISVSFGSYAKAHEAFGFEPAVNIETTLFHTWQQYMEEVGEVH